MRLQLLPLGFAFLLDCVELVADVLDALILLQERIQRNEGHSQVVIEAEKAAKSAAKKGIPYDVPAMAIRPRPEAKG